MERTFTMVKPDGVSRGLVGQIISRLEDKGFRLVGIKTLVMSEELAREHYQEHVDKPFFPEILAFITSGPVVAMVWEGPEAIATIRKMMGATNPIAALPGTIRGDWGLKVSENLIHGSDSPAAAEREINLFFNVHELLN